jgi:phenylacetate-CoA oxygenase PaaH subunit
LSRLRERVQVPREDNANLPQEKDAKPFEVFIQLQRGKPHVHAGTLDAVDSAQALQYAREHYARDQQCVHIWVCPRDAMVGTDYDKDLVWRLTDQSYRLARGYQVRKKWEQFRAKRDIDEYEKGDLKEAF